MTLNNIQEQPSIISKGQVHISQQKFALAKLAVKPARSVYQRKRQYSYWELKRLETLTTLIESHYKTDKKVSFYSDQLGIKPKTLNRFTSFCFGQTMYQLIMDRRLSESRKMLQDGSKRMKEIAYTLGFKSPECFGRFFRQSTGMSAREFKRESIRQALSSPIESLLTERICK